jgi:hypothetical protein
MHHTLSGAPGCGHSLYLHRRNCLATPHTASPTGYTGPYHDASSPAIGPFWVRRMPISLAPVLIFSRVPIW